ncbi:MAG: APC family permease [Bdellovibrionota bacterium]
MIPGIFKSFKRILIGIPIPTSEADHERLTKAKALATFSSDPLSSVAYATEEILLVLMVAGSAVLNLSIPIALAIITLLFIVVISYRQTIFTYPNGGGAYIVAKENLGEFPGLVAGAALLTDYVLTVAVSVAAGVAAITSAFPSLQSHNVALSLLAILILTAMNLRGILESSTIFAFPTYAFIGVIFVMLAEAVFKTLIGQFERISPPSLQVDHSLTLFLLLRAFSSGCTALTGVEAVSNGITAFRPPESKNAATTMLIMAFLSVTMFFGITFFANFHGIVPNSNETVVSQLAHGIFGNSIAYYFVQFTTMGILILAANTSYAGFPRLSSILAKDRFLPRQLAMQGDRLVFSNGILILSLLSALLIIVFNASTHALIPLYAVGVFLSFTLSQFGMVRHWHKEHKPGWVKQAIINAIGGTCTGVVTVVFTVTKFAHGAWIITILIPLFIRMFQIIYRHYLNIGHQLSLVSADPTKYKPEPLKHTVILPVSGMHRGILEALRYAQSIAGDVRAAYVELESNSARQFQLEWLRWAHNVPLVILKSPYRSVLQPLLDYIDDVKTIEHGEVITILIPEFVTSHWWHGLLHNQTAFFLRAALLFKRGVVVTSVRYHLE